MSKSPAGPLELANAGTASGPRSAGRPRSAEADIAILEAATAILAERGLAGMSMEEVAARAGVGKATVYRRWPSRGALALDAFMSEFRSQLPLPDTGTLRGDLLVALRSWSRAVSKTRAGRMLAGLIAEAQRDPQLATAWRERVFDPLRAQHKALVERAAQAGRDPARHGRRRRPRPDLRGRVPPSPARPPASQRPFRSPGGRPGHGRPGAGRGAPLR